MDPRCGLYFLIKREESRHPRTIAYENCSESPTRNAKPITLIQSMASIHVGSQKLLVTMNQHKLVWFSHATLYDTSGYLGGWSMQRLLFF